MSKYIFAQVICFVVSFLYTPISFALETDSVGGVKKVPVYSQQACADLCKESELCRGYEVHTTIVNDVPLPEMICHLSDGLEENSPFSFPAPPPLNLETSLADLNSYRRAHKLPALKLNKALIRAAQIHAQDLADTGTISHTGSDGSEPAERVERENYNYRKIAENVASGQTDWSTALTGWKNSKGHNENLLREGVTEFGAALVFDPKSKYATYWVMLVGSPLSSF